MIAPSYNGLLARQLVRVVAYQYKFKWSKPPKLKYDDLIKDLSAMKFKKILVITGPGIYQDPTKKAYHRSGIESQFLVRPNQFPEEIFSNKYYAKNPLPFYRALKHYHEQKVALNQTHKLLSWLAEKKILLHNFTSNIDGLEK